jgi:hypothetical protein
LKQRRRRRKEIRRKIKTRIAKIERGEAVSPLSTFPSSLEHLPGSVEDEIYKFNTDIKTKGWQQETFFATSEIYRINPENTTTIINRGQRMIDQINWENKKSLAFQIILSPVLLVLYVLEVFRPRIAGLLQSLYS